MRLVTGDTKVVDHGSGDGVYLNTTGIGLVPQGVTIHAGRAQIGDAVLVTCTPTWYSSPKPFLPARKDRVSAPDHR